MNKEELKKLAADPNHIPGIYNYCDRWCERCSFTSRCLNYKMSEEKFSDPESQDASNKAFWMPSGLTSTSRAPNNCGSEGEYSIIWACTSSPVLIDKTIKYCTIRA